MDNYELKELKVLLDIKIKMNKASSSEKELYYTVIEKLGADNVYSHVEASLLDKGLIERKDKDLVLGVYPDGVKRVTYEPYYILTDKGLKALKRKAFLFYFYKYKWIWGTLVGIVTLLGAINEMFSMF